MINMKCMYEMYLFLAMLFYLLKKGLNRQYILTDIFFL